MLLVLILRLYLLGHTVVLIQILLPVLFLLLLFIHTITPELVCQNRCFLCTERRSVQSYYSIFKVPPISMKKKLTAVLMIAVLTLSLAACQSKDDSKDTAKKLPPPRL